MSHERFLDHPTDQMRQMAERGKDAIERAWCHLIEAGFESNECALNVVAEADAPDLPNPVKMFVSNGVAAFGMPINLMAPFAAGSDIARRLVRFLDRPDADPVAVVRVNDTFWIGRCASIGLTITSVLNIGPGHYAGEALASIGRSGFAAAKSDVFAFARSKNISPAEAAAMLLVIRDMDSMKAAPIVPTDTDLANVEVTVGLRADMADRVRPFSEMAAAEVMKRPAATEPTFALVCAGFGLMTVHEIPL